MSQATLYREIAALSSTRNWEEAKLEWAVYNVWMADEPGVCLCGHRPIREMCELENSVNGNHTVVGNCCVRRFWEFNFDRLFRSLKRVRRDNTASLNKETLDFALSKGWVTEREHYWYCGLIGMRKQGGRAGGMDHRVQVNKRILAMISRKDPGDAMRCVLPDFCLESE